MLIISCDIICFTKGLMAQWSAKPGIVTHLCVNICSGKDSRFKIQKHLFDILQTSIIQINGTMWKQIKYLLMCTCLGPSLRPYGHYHKDHQRMFVRTRRTVVSKYDSNDNKTDQCLKDLSSLHHKLLHGPVMTVKGFTWNKVEWN